jgi:dTDP-4-amino-4,6-dideoxygalactose transaminase
VALTLRPDAELAPYPGASLIDAEEAQAVAEVIRSRNLFRYYGFGEPREVEEYEREWAARVGVRHALGVNSGTSALFCALVAAGVQPGDDVVVPAFAWVSLPNAVLQIGAIPVVVDVDESLTLDVEAVERSLTARTTAVVPVHMRGSCCALDDLVALAERTGVQLVEDACQAAGVTYRGRSVGSFGVASAFSTQYAKLVCTGEGGVVVTDDDGVYEAALDAHDPAAALRRGGDVSSYPGHNFRLTELSAAVGRIQLRRMPEVVARTRSYAARIAACVDATPFIERRAVHEGVEENGATVIFFASTAEHARAIRDDLVGNDVGAVLLSEPGVPDLHVSSWWRPIDAALARTGRVAPGVSRSLELLSRAVQIDVHPLFDADRVERICSVIERAGVRR